MPTSTSASSPARTQSASTSALLRSYTSSIRCGWIRPSRTSFSSVIRPISRRTGSKQDSSTASGVSSMIRLTPVTDSNARMLRPSRPMIRPFISSAGRCSTLTTLSAVCSLATRWMASTTILRARCSPSDWASASMSRTRIAASRLGPLLDRLDQLGAGVVGGQAGDALQLVLVLGLPVGELGLPLDECLLGLGQLGGALLDAADRHVDPLLALGQPALPAVEVLLERAGGLGDLGGVPLGLPAGVEQGGGDLELGLAAGLLGLGGDRGADRLGLGAGAAADRVGLALGQPPSGRGRRVGLGAGGGHVLHGLQPELGQVLLDHPARPRHQLRRDLPVPRPDRRTRAPLAHGGGARADTAGRAVRRVLAGTGAEPGRAGTGRALGHARAGGATRPISTGRGVRRAPAGACAGGAAAGTRTRRGARAAGSGGAAGGVGGSGSVAAVPAAGSVAGPGGIGRARVRRSRTASSSTRTITTIRSAVVIAHPPPSPGGPSAGHAARSHGEEDLGTGGQRVASGTSPSATHDADADTPARSGPAGSARQIVHSAGRVVLLSDVCLSRPGPTVPGARWTPRVAEAMSALPGGQENAPTAVLTWG